MKRAMITPWLKWRMKLTTVDLPSRRLRFFRPTNNAEWAVDRAIPVLITNPTDYALTLAAFRSGMINCV